MGNFVNFDWGVASFHFLDASGKSLKLATQAMKDFTFTIEPWHIEALAEKAEPQAISSADYLAMLGT